MGSQDQNGVQNEGQNEKNNTFSHHRKELTSETGVGGVEPLHSKKDWGGNCGATGVENSPTGVEIEVKPEVKEVYSPNELSNGSDGLTNEPMDKKVKNLANFENHSQPIKKGKIGMNNDSIQTNPSVPHSSEGESTDSAPQPEDFAPGMEVTFNRQLAS
ncbi:MAG: hypothetical protein QNJ36_17395 [Calothrix sp. MO_167.B42]|nr:hypothetical protein [Calothrix sp. MO_167.B42]